MFIYTVLYKVKEYKMYDRGGVWKPILIILTILLVGGGLVFVLINLFSTHEVHARVSRFEWERTITLQKLTLVPHTSRSGCPFASLACSSQIESIGSHRVKVGSKKTAHRKCSTTGTKKNKKTSCKISYTDDPLYKSVKDYGTVWHFLLPQWVWSRDIVSKGGFFAGQDGSFDQPYWASYSKLFFNGFFEREYNRSSDYSVHYSTLDGKNSYTQHGFSLSQWQHMQKSSFRYSLTVNGFNMVVRNDPLVD